MLKNRRIIKWEVLNAPEDYLKILSQSQSVLTSSLDKTIGTEESQTDSHVTAHSTINVELISYEPSTNTKDEIDIKSPTKTKCKRNLNHHIDEVPHETENESQHINEHFLKEPPSNDVKLPDPTEPCDKVHGMLNNLLQILDNEKCLFDRGFKEGFLTRRKTLLT